MDSARMPRSTERQYAPSEIITCALLTTLAVVLRLLFLDRYALHGDELGSIKEGSYLGLNWNSIAYFVILHFWMEVGSSDVVLRLPSVFFGAATVPLMFVLGRRTGGPRAALFAGLLAAVSSFNIAASQEVRFYTLYPFAVTLALLMTMRYLDSPREGEKLFFMVLSLMFVLATHLLGVAIVFSCIATILVMRVERRKRVPLLLLSLLALVSAMLLLSVPFLRGWITEIYQQHANSPGAAATSPTGITWLQVAKILAGLFFFSFGYEVYPLWLWFVIPGSLLLGWLFLRGTFSLERTGASFILLVFATAAFFAIFLILDPLAGRMAMGIAPRHVAFYWPLFVLVIALGAAKVRRFRQLVFGSCILFVCGCMACRWAAVWSYAPEPEKQARREFLTRSASKSDAVVYDGRTGAWLESDSLVVQARFEIGKLATADLNGMRSSFPRVFFLAEDFKPENRIRITEALDSLLKYYRVADANVRYPMFQYLLLGKTETPAPDSLVPAIQVLELPLEIYDLRFEDLRLPVAVEYQGRKQEIAGMCGLPALGGADSISIDVNSRDAFDNVVLFSNLSGAQGDRNETLAILSVSRAGKEACRFLIRSGIETDDWLADPRGHQAPHQLSAEAPAVVYTWPKRLQMVGQQSYDGAWREGEGKIFAACLRFPEPLAVQAVNIKICNPGKGVRLNIWGASLTRAPLAADLLQTGRPSPAAAPL